MLYEIMRTTTYRLIYLCTVANFINSADRAILPIAIIQMATEFGWSLSWQGWILSSFSYGYITSQVWINFIYSYGLY